MNSEEVAARTLLCDKEGIVTTGPGKDFKCTGAAYLEGIGRVMCTNEIHKAEWTELKP